VSPGRTQSSLVTVTELIKGRVRVQVPPQAAQVDCRVHGVALAPVGHAPPTHVPVRPAGDDVVVCPGAKKRRLGVRHAGAEHVGVGGGVEVGHAIEQLGQPAQLGDTVHAPVPVWFVWSTIESTLIVSPKVSVFVNVMVHRIVPPAVCGSGAHDFWMVPPWSPWAWAAVGTPMTTMPRSITPMRLLAAAHVRTTFFMVCLFLVLSSAPDGVLYHGSTTVGRLKSVNPSRTRTLDRLIRTAYHKANAIDHYRESARPRQAIACALPGAMGESELLMRSPTTD